jgi:hypothetical protein
MACREYIRLAGVTPVPAQSSSTPSESARPPFDWQSCVAALTAEETAKNLLSGALRSEVC